MPRGFERMSMSGEEMRRASARLAGAGAAAPSRPVFHSAEDAAEFYLRSMLRLGPTESLRALSTPAGRAGLAGPADVGAHLERRETQRNSLTGQTTVVFEQKQASVPVFGSRAVVELDAQANLIAATANVAPLRDVETTPRLSPAEASAQLRRQVTPPDFEPVAPTLTLLHVPESNDWHLTWRFERVPACPRQDDSLSLPDSAPRLTEFKAGPFASDYDFFVDARTGEIVYHFSNMAHAEIPTWCRGRDHDHTEHKFFGRARAGAFELNNPFEGVRTYDMGLSDLDTAPLPADPATNPTRDWNVTNPAAVAAHVNASRILDFLHRVLRRDGIDGRGMPVENVVNCYSSSDTTHPPPVWINAIWWRNKMWYGQQSAGPGAYRSVAMSLDVTAHELTHGITEHTAKLVYRDLPGALNESFSDIFGIIIRNWHLATPDPSDVTNWSWEIGSGLGANGGPLRDFRDPSLVGRWQRPRPGGGWTAPETYPDHMNRHVPLPPSYDHGGVHIFSNIHNKAAYNLLTSQSGGAYVFTPEELAFLYYVTLSRLAPMSDFSDARAELLNVCSVVFLGDAVRLNQVDTAVRNAYSAVGIT